MEKIKVEIKKLPNSEVEIMGTIDQKTIAEAKKNAIHDMRKDLELPGFRKGHVPENMVSKRYGEQALLEEAAKTALDSVYPKIISENKLKVVASPKVTFTKIASGNPVEFKIVVAILPEFSLPDYKKIASETKKEKPSAPTEKEIDEVILEIRKRKAHTDMHTQGKPHDHQKGPEEKDLPELNDDFAKSVGDFKSVSELKNKVKENLQTEKNIQAEEKSRITIFDKLVEETKIEVPEVLVQNELEKNLAQLKDEVVRAGIEFEDYLAQIKKGEEDIRKEWRGDAEKKARLQLILNKISEEEKIEPNKDEVQKETQKLLTLYKDADPVRARLYVAQMILNQEVIKFLDSLTQKAP